MSDSRLALRRLAEKALAGGGSVPLASLLEALVPLAELRALAQQFGLSPRGFRIDKAPSHVLAPLLAGLKDGKQLDQVVAALARPSAVPGAPDGTGAGATGEADGLPRLTGERDAAREHAARLEREVERLRRDLQRAEAGRSRAMQRESEQRRVLDQMEQDLGRLRAEIARAQQARSEVAGAAGSSEALERENHDLRQELAGFHEADAALRRQNAVYQSRIRELQELVRELEPLVPKGKRRRRRPDPAPEPVPDKRVLVPRFTEGFYRSLVDKERKGVERAIYAIMLFCTEGHAYPGLEVKQLMGQETWSLRASLGLRVYFRHLADGTVEFLEVGNREDQNTTLRRLKERS